MFCYILFNYKLMVNFIISLKNIKKKIISVQHRPCTRSKVLQDGYISQLKPLYL